MTLPPEAILTGLLLAPLAVATCWIAFRIRPPEPGTALVRTGPGGRRVSTGRTLFAIPWMHEIRSVRLTPVYLEMVCTGDDALEAADAEPVEAEVDLVCRVPDRDDAILRALRVLGDDAAREEGIVDHLVPRIAAALRHAAGARPGDALARDREAFADAVQDRLETTLETTGLTVDQVSIPEIHSGRLALAAVAPPPEATARATG